ncbi:MAG: hypothetical protein QNL88_16875 [Acidobacteriota bacterium]|nr:hypothetical protein [Acidobacteriota bacterium]
MKSEGVEDLQRGERTNSSVCGSTLNSVAPATLLILSMIVAILIPVAVAAEVVRVEITGREVVSDAPEHMRSGPYEVIRGIVHLEVDPDNPANRRIVDLQLADRNRRGKVEFSAEGCHVHISTLAAFLGPF